MKIAFFAIPHLGGTYTVFRHLRDGLAPHGHTVRWLGAGAGDAARLRARPWPEEMACGTVVAGDEASPPRQAEALAEYLARHGFGAVVINVLADQVQTNLARYLAPDITRVMLVHNTTPGTYAAAAAIRDHVHATVGVSPRICADLVRRHGFVPARTQVIANGIETTPPPRPVAAGGELGPLRLVWLGRVEDASKGVFWLPRILDRLSDLPLTLTIAGDGPDLAALRRRCARLGPRVRFAGPVAAADIDGLLAAHDVLLFPSRFEGFGLALAEAMAAGCVPVASHLAGVTDFVVAPGRCGLLFPVGDVAAAAAAVRRLAEDRTLLGQMSVAARATTHQRFGIGATAAAFASLFDTLEHARPPLAAPLPLSAWSLPAGLRPGLRTFLPRPVKNLLRQCRERLGGRLAVGGGWAR